MSDGMKPTGKTAGNPNTGTPAAPAPTMPPADVSMSTKLPPEISAQSHVEGASKSGFVGRGHNPDNMLPKSAFHGKR